MVGRDKLINALRKKKFAFKRQTERIDLFKQAGSTKRVQVPRKDTVDPRTAAFILKTAGYNDDEVKEFISACNQLN
jgi:hypothetical protein